MKQKQMRRLAKAAKKMHRIQSGNLSNDEIVNNFAYMLRAVKYATKEGKEDEENTKDNN